MRVMGPRRMVSMMHLLTTKTPYNPHHNWSNAGLYTPSSL